MKFRRLISLLIILSLTLLCGCGEAENVQTQVIPQSEEKIITMLFCSTDSFNPYSLKTQVNAELSGLLYDGLITLDNNFEPMPSLASGIDSDGRRVTLTLKDVSFTDGTKMTGEDVRFSFELAKNCSLYPSALNNASVSVSGNTVTFTTSGYDPFFVNLLDFPILKAQSVGKENEDGVELPPTGSGKYILNAAESRLVRNDGYFKGCPKYKEIKLIDTPDRDSLEHYLKAGAVDLYYENISGGEIVRMDAKKFPVNQNNLIYIGFNLNNSKLKKTNLRYAVSAAVDRSKICEHSYFGNALPATCIFHPSYKLSENWKTAEVNANTKIAIENLEKIGYNSLSGDYFPDLSFRLLVNSDNTSRLLAAKSVETSLKSVGIKISVDERPYDEYLNALSSGDFDMYIAEVKIDANMDMSNLLLVGGNSAFGISDTEVPEDILNGSLPVFDYSALYNALELYKAGQSDTDALISAISTQMPIIPLCYKTGILFYTDSTYEITNASQSDLFSSLV